MFEKFDDVLIRFILRDRRSALLAYLIVPLRNALIFGASFNDDNISATKKAFWCGVVLTLVFGINSIAEIVTPTDPTRTIILGLNAGFSPQALLTAFFFLAAFVVHTSLVGHRNKEKIPEDASVVQVDLKAVGRSGAAWGAAGLGLVALIGVFFG
jgi:hypothetical protein